MARKPKKVRPKTKDKAQAERFIETARKLGADESGKSFEKAFRKIVPVKSGKSART